MTKVNLPVSLINETVMNVLMHCVTVRDYRTLKMLGIPDELVRKLSKLSINGRILICESPAPIIETKVDPVALNLRINWLETKEKENEFINQLVLANAPLSVLKLNYGWDIRDYSERRIELGMSKPKRGRPERCHLEQCPPKLRQQLEQRIDSHEDDEQPILEQPTLLLELSDTYRIGIREILDVYTDLKKELEGDRSSSLALGGEK